jgi:alkyldihydroxyacetonephosphate synthase
VRKATGRPGLVTCRLTHVYPDGPAPYFTYYGYGDKAKLVEQFWEIKVAGSAALVDNGGTITHHHAVGRDHREWYDRERPELFAEALKGAKRVLDPQGIMNPGVLVDAAPAAARSSHAREPVFSAVSDDSKSGTAL